MIASDASRAATLTVAVVGRSGVRVRGASGRTVRAAASDAEMFDAVRWCCDRLGARAGRAGRDATSAASLVAAAAALDAVASPGPPTTDTDAVFLIVSAQQGSRAADASYWPTAADHGGAFASPHLFAATLPSAVGGEVALALGLRGPALVFAGRSLAARRMAASVASDLPPGIAFVLLVEIRGPEGPASTRGLALAAVWTRRDSDERGADAS